MKKLSAREYAVHRGVDHTAVLKAIKEGRISAAKEGSQWVIDPDVADDEWDVRTTPGADRHHLERKRPPPGPSAEADSEDGEFSDVPDMWESHKIKAYWDAEHARVRTLKAKGELLEKDEVIREVAKYLRRAREQFLTMPSRVSSALVGETDQSKIENALEIAVRECLEEFAEWVEKNESAEGTED